MERFTRLLKPGAARIRDGWGDPKAGPEFIKDLERLAGIAWKNQCSNGASRFLFAPGIVITGGMDSLNVALASLYSHAREWSPGLEVPYHVPGLQISGSSQAAGQFKADGDGWLTIDVSPEFLGIPQATWLILAHEVCHHILTQSGLADSSDSTRNERLTDTTMFVCGFGNLVRGGQTFVRRTKSGYLRTHMGYLAPGEYSYAYHWVIAQRSKERLPGMNGITVDFPRLASGSVTVDAEAELLRRLASKIPDSATRQRLLNYYRQKYPKERTAQLCERVIDDYERDRR